MAIESTQSAEDFLTASIDDYLLALADGIYQAQRQLSQVSINLQPGQPAVTYQLPKVDFEFRIAFQLAAKKITEETSSTTVSQTGGVLQVRPADAQTTGTEASAAQAASLIRGSFVAVPAQGGKPTPVVRTSVTRQTNRLFQIDVHTTTTAGEVLPGVEVQFNIDHELSAQLNKANSLNFVFQETTALSSGVVTTDAQGHATNVLTIAAAEPTTAYVAVLIDVLDQTELITFQIEG